MVAPQAEAVLAGPGLPDVLHKITARRHFGVLWVQSDGLEQPELMVCWLILCPALLRDLVGCRGGSQSDLLERQNTDKESFLLEDGRSSN